MRALVVFGLIFFVFSFFALIFSQDTSEPVIVDINPAVGEPGDIMTISGEHFGSRGVGSSVEIGGVQLTSSAFLAWTDTSIKVVLPHNVSDGLVYVETKNGRSSPSVFANRKTIPVPIAQNTRMAMPIIEAVKTDGNSVGSMVTIDGANFGTIRDSSKVLFTLSNASGTNRRQVIECSEFDKDYQFWSDTQLQVRIPEGAITGQLYVQTEHGRSTGFAITISQSVGSKTYDGLRTYTVNTNADITEIEAKEHETITLFMPYPVTSVVQRSVEVLSSNPEPQMTYSNNFVHQISQHEITSAKNTFAHSLSVDVYAVSTKVNVNSVRQYTDNSKTFYSEYLKPDSITPSDDAVITDLVSEIIGRETNPWRKAQLLYNWIIENITMVSTLHSAESPVLDALETLECDAYEVSIIYTALLRSAGIPAFTSAGILVDANIESQNHWWCEFYIEGLGWVPADPALGIGIPYEGFQKIENAQDFYFGNLDAQHITFSRGWDNMSQTQISGKKVYRPKTYALQAIWEESTEGIIKYSSYWQNAMVIGVY